MFIENIYIFYVLLTKNIASSALQKSSERQIARDIKEHLAYVAEVSRAI